MTSVATENELIISINPANGQIAGQVEKTPPEQITEAIKRAHHAQTEGLWRKMLPHERALIMRKIAQFLLDDKDRLAQLQMSENGKPISECLRIVDNAANAWIYYASVLETLETEVTPSRGNYLSHTILEPFGIVAAITPWNSPLMIESYKIAPALAAGNCVLLKPSEETPQTSLELLHFATLAGLPDNTLQVIQGTGFEVGSTLLQDDRIKMITFTGGTATGRTIAKVAAERLIPCTLELGGKSPQIVFPDADLDLAVEGVVRGICGAAGQSCTAGSRLLVESSIYDNFLSKLKTAMSKIQVAPPHLDTTQMGRFASFKHRDRVAEMVNLAQQEGATIELGGYSPKDALASGAYYAPTLLTGLSSNTRTWNEEIFGPVLCAKPFETQDDLIRDANCGDYGLAAGIWTRDFQKAWEIGRAIDAGTIWINTYEQSSISTPFGGFKQSGIGREKAAQCLRTYSQTKSFYWGMA